MSDLPQLLEGNRRFSAHFADGKLPIRPRLSTVVLTCLDARVDPAHLFDLQLGDALVIRNAGGRVNPGVLTDLAVLGLLTAALPADKAMTLELVILHHTDCGMSRFADPAGRGSGLAPIPSTVTTLRCHGEPRAAATARGLPVRSNG